MPKIEEYHALKYFKSLGCDILGVDGSPTAIRNSVVPQDVVEHDFCKGTYVPKKKYDMIWSCEFVEHVRPRYLLNFLKTFEFSNKYIFMTHAQPGQCGWHHVNCMTDDYWIKLLSIIGFRFNPQLTTISRNLDNRGYFSKSGLVFVKKNPRIHSYFFIKMYIIYLHTYQMLKKWTVFLVEGFKKELCRLWKIIDKGIGLLGIFLKKNFPQKIIFSVSSGLIFNLELIF